MSRFQRRAKPRMLASRRSLGVRMKMDCSRGWLINMEPRDGHSLLGLCLADSVNNVARGGTTT
jgi:hypothetical protein